MKNVVDVFRLLSDETRIRILMLLSKKELCVCQIMGVLGISQPLVSRNLSLLGKAGFLDERREGKLIFYSPGKNMSPLSAKAVRIIMDELKNNGALRSDLESLADCIRFQEKTGKCDMRTFMKFMEKKRKRIKRGI